MIFVCTSTIFRWMPFGLFPPKSFPAALPVWVPFWQARSVSFLSSSPAYDCSWHPAYFFHYVKNAVLLQEFSHLGIHRIPENIQTGGWLIFIVIFSGTYLQRLVPFRQPDFRSGIGEISPIPHLQQFQKINKSQNLCCNYPTSRCLYFTRHIRFSELTSSRKMPQ